MQLTVAGKIVGLTKIGSKHLGLCPYHQSETRTLVAENDSSWQCVLCGRSSEAPQKESAEKVMNNRLLALNDAACERMQAALNSPDGRSGQRYIKARGLSSASVRDFRIGFCTRSLLKDLRADGFTDDELVESGLFKQGDPAKGGVYTPFRDRLMYPISDPEGRTIGFGGRVVDVQRPDAPKYINSPDTPVFVKGQNLYGFSQAKKSKHEYAVLVEGYMDVIAMHAAGYDNAVASLGTALTEEQALLLKSRFDNAVLLYDTDNAGRRATARAIKMLRAAGIKMVVANTLPFKDPDEMLREHGGIDEAIKKAVDPKAFLFASAMAAEDFNGAVDALIV